MILLTGLFLSFNLIQSYQMKRQSPNIVNWLTNTTRKSNRADSKTGSIDLEKRHEKESVRRDIY